MASRRNDGPLAGTASAMGEGVSELSIAICLFRTTLFSALVAQTIRQCQHSGVGGLRNRGQFAPALARRRGDRGADRDQRQMGTVGTDEVANPPRGANRMGEEHRRCGGQLRPRPRRIDRFDRVAGQRLKRRAARVERGPITTAKP